MKNNSLSNHKSLIFLLAFIVVSINFIQAQNCHIVVLGSSTAAGGGASSIENSWVKLYESDLAQQNSNYTITNLGQGGMTTYNILPDGSYTPPGFYVDQNRNLTKALSLGADIIIVNMPSNDTSNGFTVEEQMNNFDLLYDESNCAGVEMWICTTQPKSSFPPNKVQIQEDVRDAIFDSYGIHAIDFWNGIADGNGHLLAAYDSGDGTHLNDAGHQFIKDRAWSENIQLIDCTDYNCPQNYNSNSTLRGIECGYVDYQAQAALESIQVIQPNADVDYTAGNIIRLKPGFHAIKGSDFNASIASCNSSLQESSEEEVMVESNYFEEAGSFSDVQTEKGTFLKVFPNPFQGSTNVMYNLSEAGVIKVSVHDNTGREVAVIENSIAKEKGEYQMEFEASHFPSGIYSVRLISGTVNLTHKMIIVN